MVERIGLDHTKQLWALSEQGLDYVRRTIAETGMPGVDPVAGWLHISKTDNGDEIDAEVERLRWIGANVEAWPTERVREVLPNKRYFNALHFPGAIHIHPLNYALGLAADAEKAGARIFEDTPALAIDAAGVRKRIDTPGGARARGACGARVQCAARRSDAAARRDADADHDFRAGDRADRAEAARGGALSRRGQRHQPRRQSLPHRRRRRTAEKDCSGPGACAPGRPIRAGSRAG